MLMGQLTILKLTTMVKFDISSILIFIFSLFASIVFWVFIAKGDVYDNWYPLVGHLVASHGALIGIIYWEYLKNKK